MEAIGGNWKQTEANGSKRRRFLEPGKGVPTFNVGLTKLDFQRFNSNQVHSHFKPIFYEKGYRLQKTP
ncbi:MAG TPA: hypothetical protein DCL77_07240 [Prolixibacteraceae bacterium]|jgi:hypothetical protein|nr:hypothetical protein [Prolixibacteraceae bacterium]